MRLALASAGAPQAAGRTPHRSALRLPGAEALLTRGATPRTPPMPPEASEARAREAIQ